MHFELTPEQQAVQEAAIEFARRELNESMIERDASQSFSRNGWQKCAAFGVQGMPIPKEYGGRGSDPITTIAMMEGLGFGGSDQGLLFAINAHMWTTSIPLLMLRDRGAETQISSRFVRWQFHWCKRDKRAGGWVGRILNANPRCEKWKWLHVERQENFCYERSSR